MPTNTAYAAAVIGPAELISGLQAIGMKTYPATNAAEAIAAYLSIKESGLPFACVCVTESIMNELSQDDRDTMTKDSLPVILTIPDFHSDKNAGLDKLRELAKRAIGSDIFTN